MIIRNATMNDVPWIVEQAKIFDEYYNGVVPFFSETYARENAVALINGRGIVLISEQNGHRTGFISGIISPHIYNPTIRVLVEMLWWVIPMYRKTRAGAKLLRAFTAWGKDNADMLTISIPTKTYIREESMKKNGWGMVEKTFVWGGL